MMHDGWIAPLVALIESADTVVQSVGLALLSKIIHTGRCDSACPSLTWLVPPQSLLTSHHTLHRILLVLRALSIESAEAIFVVVGGMKKLVELLYSDVSNVQYLALEAIYALCARNSTC